MVYLREAKNILDSSTKLYLTYELMYESNFLSQNPIIKVIYFSIISIETWDDK